jgi:hypothetical protein
MVPLIDSDRDDAALAGKKNAKEKFSLIIKLPSILKSKCNNSLYILFSNRSQETK